MRFRRLEINGGQVHGGPHWKLVLPPSTDGYADAQIDDYGFEGMNRRQFPWLPGTVMRLRAKFSHSLHELIGTAGFGFWNAPFADPTIRWPTLPQATWFFFASPPTDLPLAQNGPSRDWFAATLDTSSASAMAMIPLAPLVLLLNQSRRLRSKIWPVIQRRLKISYAPIASNMEEWHQYELLWAEDGCSFIIDEVPVLQTRHSPSGPLGFVCWIDNQYLIANNRGRLSWGTLPTPAEQVLEISDLRIE